MTSVVRFVGALSAFGAISLCSAQSFAGDKDWNVGVGLMGIVGGNFQSKPERATFDPDINPGFGGVTGGSGFVLDSRFFNLIGLEVDIIHSSDKGTGDVTFNGATSHVTIGQGAWHFPILAKVTFPSPLLTPMVFIGPEVIAPSKENVSVDPTFAMAGFGQTVSTYVMLTFGGGIEIKLPIPVIDLRIPITIRGSWNPSVSSKFADRTPTQFVPTTYKSDWQYAVNGTLGAAIYF
jgi:hypothetical protein